MSEAHNLVRGLAPVPGATIDIDGVSVKVLAAGRSESSPKSGSWEDVGGLPVVGFDGGGLELRMVQPEGKRVMGGDDWLRGLRRDRGTAR